MAPRTKKRKTRYHTNDRIKNKIKRAMFTPEQRMRYQLMQRERTKRIRETETLLEREERLARTRARQRRSAKTYEKFREESRLRTAQIRSQKQEERENVERWMQSQTTETFETKIWRCIRDQLFKRPEKVLRLTATPIKHVDFAPLYPDNPYERNCTPESEYTESCPTEDGLNSEENTTLDYFGNPDPISGVEVVMKVEPDITESEEQEMILSDVHIPCIEPEMINCDVQLPCVNKPVISEICVQHEPMTSVTVKPGIGSQIQRSFSDNLIQTMPDNKNDLSNKLLESPLTKDLSEHSKHISETDALADFTVVKSEINIKTEEIIIN